MSEVNDPVPAVFIVAPRHLSDKQDSARIAMQRAVEKVGLRCFTRRVSEFRVSSGDESGRMLHIVEPHDSQQVYSDSHERAVAVFQMGSARVVLDPEARPSTRNTISLQRFVHHKAFFGQFGRVENGFDPKVLLGGFEDWQASCECDGERDARCLPLHVFSPSKEWISIDTSEGVREFEVKHGPATSRLDEAGRIWKIAKALHGQGVTRIAGVDLRAGFHWDVTSNSSAARLTTTTEVWRFKRGAYCNVYPNAIVRQGQSAGGHSARRIFQAKRPHEHPVEAEVVNGKRSSGRRRGGRSRR